MRELERERNGNPRAPSALTIVGPGRVGRAIAGAAAAAGIDAALAGRAEAASAASGAEAVLLCVPDVSIPEACRTVSEANPRLRLLGHTSGATGLDALEAAVAQGASVFSIHPLQTIRGERSDLAGAPCAISGSDPAAFDFAEGLAIGLGMRPFVLPEGSRAAYHAAATVASNFLMALEESAVELLEAAGVDDARELLAPLVLRSADNWAEHGPAALTGPIARGDEQTIARHLEAIVETDPELLDLYRALAERTRRVARRESEESVA